MESVKAPPASGDQVLAVDPLPGTISLESALRIGVPAAER
jgi:hypothetical protein